LPVTRSPAGWENIIQVLNAGSNIDIGSGYGVSAAGGMYRHLLVEGKLLQTSQQDVTPLLLNFASAPPFAESVGDLVVKANQIEAQRTSRRSAVTATAVGRGTGTLELVDNRISISESDFMLVAWGRVGGPRYTQTCRKAIRGSNNGSVQLSD
jgi:hypothetical protein